MQDFFPEIAQVICILFMSTLMEVITKFIMQNLLMVDRIGLKQH